MARGLGRGCGEKPDEYHALGIDHFVLSDTPYLAEIKRQGDTLLPLLRPDSLRVNPAAISPALTAAQ